MSTAKILKREFFIFIILTYIFSFGFISVSIATAQERQSDSHAASESAKINYDLPYPGLIPDHPLYFLKAARDKIISFFISDPIKKAEHDLLQSDKRIAASLILIEKGNINLAQSTFSKAENYFEEAIMQVNYAKMQGMHTGEIGKKLQEANLKHQQVLKNTLDNMDKNEKVQFAIERERLIDFQQKVIEILPKD